MREPMFKSKRLPAVADGVAPDGSEVRVLLGLTGGGLAHLRLEPGETSVAVPHRSPGGPAGWWITRVLTIEVRR